MKGIYLSLAALLSVTGLQAATAGYSGTKTNAGVTYDLTEYDKKDGVPLNITKKVTTCAFSEKTCQVTVSAYTTQSRTDIFYCNAIPTAVEDSKVSVDLSDFVITENGGLDNESTSEESFIWSSTGYENWRTTIWNLYVPKCPFFISNGSAKINAASMQETYPDGVIEWGCYDSTKPRGQKIQTFSSFEELKAYFPSAEMCAYWREDEEDNGIKYFTYYVVNTIVASDAITTSVTNQYNCQVTRIQKNGAFENKQNLQSVTISKSVWDIEAGAFEGSTKLNTFTTEDGGNFTSENSIVYDDAKKTIVVAAANVASQEIPLTVTEIEDYAFYNATSPVTITSMNGSLTVGANQGANFTVINPSESLAGEVLTDGGYKVTGNITQSNYNALNIPTGVLYVDFTDANVLEDIVTNNTTNAMYYFTTDKVVSGENIVNNGVCAKLHVYDSKTKFYVPTEFTADSAIYDRKFTTNWATMCLPFSVREDEELAMFCGALTDYDKGQFTFTYATSIMAYKPYAVRAKESDNFYIRVKNAEVPATRTAITTAGAATFTGVFAPTSVACTAETYHYGIKDCKFVKIEGATVNTFRAYLSVPKEATSEAATLRFVDAMDQLIESVELENTTGIENANAQEINHAVYDLQGQRKAVATRGLNIVKGKVVIIK